MFKNREDAGRKLVNKLEKFKGSKNTVVIALPRGGVVLGYEIAKALSLPLDIVVPRKIGAPGNEEFAIGALTEEGIPIYGDDVDIKAISKEYLDSTIEKEKQEAQRRLRLYKKGPSIDLHNKIALIVDDGIATGLTMKAAITSIKNKGAKSIAVAVPVSSRDSASEIKVLVDEFICLDTPYLFMSIGQFYHDFPQTSDGEVISLMKKATS